MDGRVWHTMRGVDGRFFFDEPDDKTKVHIGVTISLDWYAFLYVTSLSLTWIPGLDGSPVLMAPVIHWGPFCFAFQIYPLCSGMYSGFKLFKFYSISCIVRYCVQNLLIAAMTPGPPEPTCKQLQHYLKIIVDDLIYLRSWTPNQNSITSRRYV